MHSKGTGNQWTSRFIGAPVTKWLLMLNVAIFLVDFLSVGEYSMGRLTPYGFYSTSACFEFHEYWRLLSFQFLHGSFMHLLSNMIGLYMFGGIVERVLGSRQFAVYYLLCGIAGALTYTVLESVGWLNVGGLVGASAGIFGILVALILIAPDLRVMLLFPPIPMKMKTFGMLVLGIGAFVVLTNGDNSGGEAGHLGGALLGFILMKNRWMLDWVDGRGGEPRGKRGPKPDYTPKLRPRTELNLESSEVDRILDKVNAHGVHSLTEEERATLLRVSKKD